MTGNNPYSVIKRRYITEKASVLQGLKDAKSNRSVARCENPRAVFIVDTKANKQEIKAAVEEIYKDKHIKVVAVNTINVKPKQYRPRGRTRPGRATAMKKAIVTFAVGNSIDE